MRQDQTVLYRCYDASKVLLYIGTTNNIDRRLKMHAGQSFWASDVAETTTELYESGYIARAAERKAISSERPKYNVMCNSPDALYVAPENAVNVLIEHMNEGVSFGRAAIAARIQAPVAKGIAKRLGLKFADGRCLLSARAAGVTPAQIKPELSE